VTLLDLVLRYWPSAAAFATFGALHSLGAQDGVKRALAGLIGPFAVEHFWRLAYCAASYAALYHLIGPLHWGRHPEADVWLVRYPEWLWRGLVVAHLGSIALLYSAFLQSDYLEFWGLRQAWRGVRIALGSTSVSAPRPAFGSERLVTGGVYGWVRHPMLSGGLLFLLTSGPSLNNLVFLVLYLAYMLIGGYYEERRLLRVFGERYRAYQHAVGAFVPRLRRPARTTPGVP